MHVADRVLVAVFLMQAKELIDARRLDFYNRAKNIATLSRLGLRMQHQIEILQSLQPRNYSHSIEPREGTIEDGWVFGIMEQNVELYIKLNIVDIPSSGERLVCVSFHEAEQPLSYPYR